MGVLTLESAHARPSAQQSHDLMESFTFVHFSSQNAHSSPLCTNALFEYGDPFFPETGNAHGLFGPQKFLKSNLFYTLSITPP